MIQDAQELKVKSQSAGYYGTSPVCYEADVVPTEDGMIITGGKTLYGAVLDSHLDCHCIAIAFAIAGMAAEGEQRLPGQTV